MPKPQKPQTAKSKKAFKGLKVSKAAKVPASKVNAARQLVPMLQAADGSVLIDYVGLFKTVIGFHANAKKWELGDFIGIKTLSNTKVGAVGQDFIEDLCRSLNILIDFPVSIKKTRATQSPWDIKMFGLTFELKTATEDTGGKFQFNHIRYHRPYDAVFCLGVSPDKLLFNVYSKAEIATGKAGKLVSMEKGGNASYKLTKSKSELLPIEDFETKIKSFVASFV